MTSVSQQEVPSLGESRSTAILSAAARHHVWVGNMRRDQVEYHGPLVMDSATGIYLSTPDNKQFVDAMAGAWVVNAGHGRQEIVKAIADQAARLPFALNEGYTNPTTVALAERLLQLAPGDYSRVFFTSGGSEAIETARKMVRQRRAVRGTPRHKAIGRQLLIPRRDLGCDECHGIPRVALAFCPSCARSIFHTAPDLHQVPALVVLSIAWHRLHSRAARGDRQS